MSHRKDQFSSEFILAVFHFCGSNLSPEILPRKTNTDVKIINQKATTTKKGFLNSVFKFQVLIKSLKIKI